MDPHSRSETYGTNPRAIGPEAARQVALIRAAVPDEIRALRLRLPQIREGHPGNQAVQRAADEVSRALDALTLALSNAVRGIDDPDDMRRLGPR